MKHPPRDGDLPREELMRLADQAVTESGGFWDVHFKFTCEHCGHRCMFQEPNMLFENGECSECGKKTEVKYGGFTLVSKGTLTL